MNFSTLVYLLATLFGVNVSDADVKDNNSYYQDATKQNVIDYDNTNPYKDEDDSNIYRLNNGHSDIG